MDLPFLPSLRRRGKRDGCKFMYRISKFSSSPLMGEVRCGWREKNHHPPLTPPIEGGETVAAYASLI